MNAFRPLLRTATLRSPSPILRSTNSLHTFPRLQAQTLRPRIPQLPRRSSFPRFNSTAPLSSPPPPSPPNPAPGISARLKSLSKEYGYSAVGVYILLSAIDFPFCFLAVRLIGTERIAAYEEALLVHIRPVMFAIRDTLGLPPKRYKGDVEEEIEGGKGEGKEGEEHGKNGATIWTVLALSYAVHKSLIFFRVPLTAVVTPKIVKTLRGWGWEVGRKGGVREGVRGIRSGRGRDIKGEKGGKRQSIDD